MTNFEGRGLVGGWVAVLAMGLGACGGTVDLRGEAGGAGGKAAAGAISIGSSDAGGADDHGGTGGQPSSGPAEV